jgi:hypothetical protein
VSERETEPFNYAYCISQREEKRRETEGFIKLVEERSGNENT